MNELGFRFWGFHSLINHINGLYSHHKWIILQILSATKPQEWVYPARIQKTGRAMISNMWWCQPKRKIQQLGVDIKKMGGVNSSNLAQLSVFGLCGCGYHWMYTWRVSRIKHALGVSFFLQNTTPRKKGSKEQGQRIRS